jgi:hypothetical protein
MYFYSCFCVDKSWLFYTVENCDRVNKVTLTFIRLFLKIFSHLLQNMSLRHYHLFR